MARFAKLRKMMQAQQVASKAPQKTNLHSVWIHKHFEEGPEREKISEPS